ncbi:MAG: hypothetical protein RLZZ241_1908 [Bacteroidota bacterium]
MEQRHKLPFFKTIINEQVHLLLYLDPYNRRMRIDSLSGDLDIGLSVILNEAPVWAEKLILKARTEQISFFTAKGWSQEGRIPRYFQGADLVFLTCYPFTERQGSHQLTQIRAILYEVMQSPPDLQNRIDLDVCISTPQDAERLAQLYAAVFKIYPTPMHDPDYVLKTMQDGTLYVHVEQEGRLLSAASAEVNIEFANAELTDCATLSFAQGRGYMYVLLDFLEKELLRREINCLYTLCRAQSLGMNRVFYKLGYRYSGCLLNNCMIYSGLEHMNVWYKNVNE